MWVTWKHQDRELSWPLSFEQKVELFYEQALGWQLHIADLVANGGNAFGEQGQREGTAVSSVRHSGFAVLQICLSYFETIGRYAGVESGSKAAFGKGVLEVFPELAADTSARTTAVIDSLYKDARCGLYHNVRSARVGLGWPPDGGAIAYDSPSARVVVNPERLPKVLKAHLERFRDALLNKDNQALRAVFETRFDADTGHQRMSDAQPANDATFKVVDAFNKSGFPFQDAVLEETGRLFSAKKSRWVFEVAEYPVSVGGRSARIDFVLSHPNRPLFLLAECKRVLSGGGWGFARSGYVRRDYNEHETLVDELRLSSTGQPVRGSVSLDVPARPVYHQSGVVKSSAVASKSGFKVDRDAINNACTQIFVGVNGFLNQLAQSHELWDKRAVLIPVVFTTAPLLVVDCKLSEADLSTGELPPTAEVTGVPWLWLRQHVSPTLVSSQQIERSEYQRLGESLSRQLDNEFGRTVAVVNYSGIEEFLWFTGEC